MLKYRGTYRVLFEIDARTGKAAEFTYIPCRIRKGAEIYRYNDDTLAAYILGIQTVNRLLREHSDIFRPFKTGDSEAILLFTEQDIEHAALILKARIKGRNMNPRPKKTYNLTEERRRILSESMAAIRSNRKSEQ